MGRHGDLGRMRRLWPLDRALAGLRRFGQLPPVSQTALQAGNFSNVDNESFAASNERLKVAFDAIYTAEDIGSYKPSNRNFEYMLEKLKTLGIKKHQVLHTAESLFHDHVSANKHGLTSCWIHRRHDQKGFGATINPGETPEYAFSFNSMADLVTAHRNELGG